MNNLGLLCLAEDRLPEADALLQASWETRRRLLGPEHPDTVVSAYNLAEVYTSLGKLSELKNC